MKNSNNSFEPIESTGVVVSSDATSNSLINFGYGYKKIAITNLSYSTISYVKIGFDSLVATTNDFPILPGAQVILKKDFAEQNIAYITPSGDGRLHIVAGEGHSDFAPISYPLPNLDFPFAAQKNLNDIVSGSSLITFTRASTATFVGSNGLIQTATTDVPRFDHNPVTRESLGLLIEEQKTNLVLRSEEFDNASWTKSQATITTNSIVSPNGIASADTLVEDTANSNHFVFQSYTFTANTHTYSVFAKAASRSFIRLIAFDGVSSPNAYFNISTGVIGTIAGGATASIGDYGNGWYRCSITFTSVVGAGNVAVRLATANGTDSYAGNGTSGIYLWGAQLEVGAFPTSYIPTTTATVTRSADLASITGTNFSSWYNPTEGTMFADAKRDFAVPSGPFPRVWQIQGALSNSRIELSFFNAGQASFIATSGVTQFEWYPMYYIQNGLKSAQALGTNNVAAATNGEVTATDTSVTLPTVQEMRIGGDGGSSNIFNGTIRRLAYYPRRLSHTELQLITS